MIYNFATEVNIYRVPYKCLISMYPDINALFVNRQDLIESNPDIHLLYYGKDYIYFGIKEEHMFLGNIKDFLTDTYNQSPILVWCNWYTVFKILFNTNYESNNGDSLYYLPDKYRLYVTKLDFNKYRVALILDRVVILQEEYEHNMGEQKLLLMCIIS